MEEETIDLILRQAAASPHGLAVKTNSPERFQQLCYRGMKRLGLSLRTAIPAAPGEVWLLPKGPR